LLVGHLLISILQLGCFSIELLPFQLSMLISDSNNGNVAHNALL
jgi:hypothetical protein